MALPPAKQVILERIERKFDKDQKSIREAIDQMVADGSHELIPDFLDKLRKTARDANDTLLKHGIKHRAPRGAGPRLDEIVNISKVGRRARLAR